MAQKPRKDSTSWPTLSKEKKGFDKIENPHFLIQGVVGPMFEKVNVCSGGEQASADESTYCRFVFVDSCRMRRRFMFDGNEHFLKAVNPLD